MIVFSTIFAATTNSVTHSLTAGISFRQILFLKCLGGLLVLVVWQRSNFFNIWRSKLLPYHALKGFMGALGNWAWISALQHVPLAKATSLSLLSSLFTSLGGIFLYKEKVVRRFWLALAIAFLGVFSIIHPGDYNFEIWVLLPIISAFCFSVSSLLVKTLARQDSSVTILAYLLLFMMLFSLSKWQAISWFNTAIILAIGICYSCTQICLIEAYSYAETTYLAPFKFARFPLGSIIGFFFFQEIPSFGTITGGCIILLVYIYLGIKP